MNSDNNNALLEQILKDSKQKGFLTGQNQSRQVITSDDTIIRRPNNAVNDVVGSAVDWARQFFSKNNRLAKLYTNDGVMDNKQILSYSLNRKAGLPMLPNKEAYACWQKLPNAYFDRESSCTPEEFRYDKFRDPYGQAGGMPEQGRSYIYPNFLAYANPWGAGGPLFEAVGNNYRDPDFKDKEPRKKKTVRFNCPNSKCK